MKQPINNEKTQESVSRSRSTGIRNGARKRVREALRNAKSYSLPVKSVLVVGSQHGYEPEQYKELGVGVVAVDIVKSFVEDTRKLGIECYYSAIEDFEPIKVDGVHASHVLEHTYDIRKAISVIQKCARYWCYVCVPIKPEGKKRGKGDLSVIRNKKKILDLFKPWKGKIIHKSKTTIVILFIAP